MSEQAPDSKPPSDESDVEPNTHYESIFGRPTKWTETFRQRDAKAADSTARTMAGERDAERAQTDEDAKLVRVDQISICIATLDADIRGMSNRLETLERMCKGVENPTGRVVDDIKSTRANLKELIEEREETVSRLRALTGQS